MSAWQSTRELLVSHMCAERGALVANCHASGMLSPRIILLSHPVVGVLLARKVPDRPNPAPILTVTEDGAAGTKHNSMQRANGTLDRVGKLFLGRDNSDPYRAGKCAGRASFPRSMPARSGLKRLSNAQGADTINRRRVRPLKRDHSDFKPEDPCPWVRGSI